MCAVFQQVLLIHAWHILCSVESGWIIIPVVSRPRTCIYNSYTIWLWILAMLRVLLTTSNNIQLCFNVTTEAPCIHKLSLTFILSCFYSGVSFNLAQEIERHLEKWPRWHLSLAAVNVHNYSQNCSSKSPPAPLPALTATGPWMLQRSTIPPHTHTHIHFFSYVCTVVRHPPPSPYACSLVDAVAPNIPSGRQRRDSGNEEKQREYEDHRKRGGMLSVCVYVRVCGEGWLLKSKAHIAVLAR